MSDIFPYREEGLPFKEYLRVLFKREGLQHFLERALCLMYLQCISSFEERGLSRY